MVATATLYFEQDEVVLLPALLWLVAFFLYTVILGSVLSKLISGLNAADLDYLVWSMVLIDAILVVSLVHFSGGVATMAVVLIPLFIIYHAIYRGYRSGLLSATLFSLLYVGSAFLEGEIVTDRPLWVSQVALFYVLAVFSGYLAQRLSQGQGRERDLLQELVVQAGVTHGVHVMGMTFADDTAAMEGQATDEATMQRFLESLRGVRGFSSVRLARVVRQEGDPRGAISFTVAARVK
jgi:hypothetical protein